MSRCAAGVGEHPHVFPSRHRGARRTIATALAITLVMGAVEVAGGLLSNSLSLQADAAHMFMDSAALSIALAGLALLSREPRGRQTFGYHRAEVLGALLNGMLLVGIAAYVLWRAYERLLRPEPVQGPLMLAVAVLGLAVNGVALLLLHRHDGSSLGARGASLHILSDAVTSVAAIVAGALVWLYGLQLADPVIALLIVAFILRGAVGLLRESGGVLMEAAPPTMDADAVGRMLREPEGVRDAHDLHLWSLTPGVDALTAHVEVGDMGLVEAIALKERLKDRLHAAGFVHVVLELDHPAASRTRTAPEAGHGHPH